VNVHGNRWKGQHRMTLPRIGTQYRSRT
jgi:hypothetical protein